MNKGYSLASPRAYVYDSQVHTITEDFVKEILKNIRVKHKKIWSIVCIVIASFILELGIAFALMNFLLCILFLAAGGFMLYRSIQSLKQAGKNIKRIEDGNFYFEKAVCSEIEYDPEANDTMKFEGKSYFTIASSDDRVGMEYYVLFFDKESYPVFVFSVSHWALAPELENMLK